MGKMRHREASTMSFWTQLGQNPSSCTPVLQPLPPSLAAPRTNLEVPVVVLAQQLQESQDRLHNQNRHPHFVVLALLSTVMALPKP